MGDLLNELANPVWWLSVVVAGILVNLASSYLKSRLDKSVSATAGWWRRRSERRRKLWQDYVKHLAASVEARIQARHMEIRLRLQAIMSFLFAVAFSVIGIVAPLLQQPSSRYVSIGALFLSALLAFIAYLCIRDAVKRGQAVHAAMAEI
ncbi:hypothetical protein [Luteimonas sp. A478]